MGKVIGIDRFGESAPMKDLFKEFGLTVENVVEVGSIITGCENKHDPPSVSATGRLSPFERQGVSLAGAAKPEGCDGRRGHDNP